MGRAGPPSPWTPSSGTSSDRSPSRQPGGGSARGNLRFDQLVAADNRDDARRLGLLNDDELDSDNEGGKEKKEGDDEIEDETALLDQMLKDRFLQRDREAELEENFSDDEDGEDDAEGEDEGE